MPADTRSRASGQQLRADPSREVAGRTILAALLVVSLFGCRQDMHDQPKYDTLEASVFFADGRASRPPVPGTVARGGLRLDAHLHTGKVDGVFVRSFPFRVTDEVMARGRERYEIFCTPCHSRVGDGRGMAVLRGIAPPPSFHIDRLRNIEEGYLFDVIGNGFGRMYGYGAQIEARDRWAIVAYLRALQLSQNARPDDLPQAARRELQRSGGGR
ncbi:MAG TPA: cytochrome c [Candidatus Polarisedimenticolia bacterium]|nr:cytochrome c [Candidatus Polarisedimenticolia bacterium]